MALGMGSCRLFGIFGQGPSGSNFGACLVPIRGLMEASRGTIKAYISGLMGAILGLVGVRAAVAILAPRLAHGAQVVGHASDP